MITHATFKHNGLEFSGPITKTAVVTGGSGSGKTRFLDAVFSGVKSMSLQDSNNTNSYEVVYKDFRFIRNHESHVAIEDNTSSVFSETKGRPSVIYFDSERITRDLGPVRVLAEDVLGTGSIARTVKRRIVNTHGARAFGPEGLAAFQKGANWMESLNHVWDEFRGDDTYLRVDAKSSDPNSYLYADIFVMKGEERICSIGEAGSSAMNFFAIFGPLVVLGPFDIVFIDIPELHMDANGEGKFMRILRHVAPESQFIISTYSSSIISQNFPSDIIYL